MKRWNSCNHAEDPPWKASFELLDLAGSKYVVHSCIRVVCSNYLSSWRRLELLCNKYADLFWWFFLFLSKKIAVRIFSNAVFLSVQRHINEHNCTLQLTLEVKYKILKSYKRIRLCIEMTITSLQHLSCVVWWLSFILLWWLFIGHNFETFHIMWLYTSILLNIFTALCFSCLCRCGMLLQGRRLLFQ